MNEPSAAKRGRTALVIQHHPGGDAWGQLRVRPARLGMANRNRPRVRSGRRAALF